MTYDVIVIGGGPAGVSASIYIKRAGYNVLLFSNEKSSLQKTDKIANYYGFEEPITGEDLLKRGIKQAGNLGIKILNKEVIGIKYSDDISEEKYNVIVVNEEENAEDVESSTNFSTTETYEAKIIVIATGVNRNRPNIKGITEFEGKGVSYCAVCDGAFYRGKNVAVLGSGNYAVGEIEELLPLVNEVTMLTNGAEEVEIRGNVLINRNSIKEVRGSNKIEEIEFEDGSTKKIDGLFIAQGSASSIDFAKKIGAKIENNAIVVNENMETTVKNIYACGDCTGGILQVSKAVYDGTKAGLNIIKKLRGGN